LEIFYKRYNILALFIALIFIVINAIMTVKGQYWFYLVPLVVFIFYLAVVSLDTMFFVVVAFVPLSIQLSDMITWTKTDMALPTEPIIAGMMLLFFLKLIHEKSFDKNIFKHPVSLAILFNLGWILITAFTSTMPLVSFKFFLSRLWFVVVFYFLATQVFSKYRNSIKYILIYSISLIPVIFYAVIRLSKEGLTNKVAANWVVTPFYNDHTAYGAALALLIPALIGIFVIRRKYSLVMKAFLAGLIFLLIVAIVLSSCRAAWLSLIVAAIFFTGLFFKIKLRYIFLILAIIAGTFYLFKTEILISLERNKQDSSATLGKHVSSITNISTDASNVERLNRWSCAIRMFEDKPIFGYGPGTYQFKYAPYQLQSMKTIISTNAGTGGNAHSEYLGPLSESGILGSLSFILIVIASIYTASRIYFNSHRRKVRLFALTLLIGMITYYAHGIMNNFLDTDKLSALFWGFTAMIVALDVYFMKDKASDAEANNFNIPPTVS
jgi:putative inorganic carbon (hco3(-)) transporter